MNRVLLKLYLLTIKGSIRGIGRRFQTVRGAILTLVTFSFFIALIVHFIFMLTVRRHLPTSFTDRADLISGLLPLGMLAYVLFAASPSLGERAIQFSPSEIDFLFPAPFTRRQLLAYFLWRGLLGKMTIASLLAISLATVLPSLPCAVVGIFLSLVFLHGAAVAGQFAQQWIGTQLFSHSRRIVMGVVVVVLGVAVARSMPAEADPWTFLAEFRQTAAIRIITAPFAFFSRVIVARQLFPSAIFDIVIATGITALVYAFVFSLDSRFEDIAVKTSERNYQRIQAARSGNVYTMISGRAEYTRSPLPQLPWWRGLGPNLRRQLVSGLRVIRSMIGNLLVLGTITAVTLYFVLHQNPKLIQYLGYGVIAATAYLTFIIAAQLPLGFRGDLSQIEVLKSLPISPLAIAAAEVVSATAITCLGQWMFTAIAALAAPSQLGVLVTGAAFYVPYNLLLFGISNLLLLLFPFRLVSASPDLTLMGRLMIMMTGNVATLAIAAAVAAIPAALMFLLTSSWTAAMIVLWIGLTTLGGGFLAAVAWAFERFDISTDMPD